MFKLITVASSAIDHLALKGMEAMWILDGDPTSDDASDRHSRAFEIYASDQLRDAPLSFYPEPPPAECESQTTRRLPNGRIERLSWRSGYQTWDSTFQGAYDAFERNQTAWAEWHRHDDAVRPVIICLHSWATSMIAVQRRVFAVRTFYEAGLDVVLFILPFHGPRRPKSARFDGQHFPGTDPQRTNEGWGQVVWDVRSLLGYLSERGRTVAGAMGMSLGGYATALLAGVEPRLSFAVPMIPMVSYADLLWWHGRKSKRRAAAEARGVTLERLRLLHAVHAPLNHQPLIDKERLMILAGRGDRIVPPEHVQMLWEHWQQPQIHWFKGGHLTQFGRGGAYQVLQSFLHENGVI